MVKTKEKKTTKEVLIKELREHKKKLKNARFRLSVEDQRRTHRRGSIRKDIARVATALRGLAKGGKMVDDTVTKAAQRT